MINQQSITETFILKDREFKKIAKFIESKVGIKMPDAKKLMMQSRLQVRLKALNLTSFDEYIDYVFSSEDAGTEETILMIDAMTTNLTEFYREATHFTFLSNTALPKLIGEGKKSFKVWSAGCSSGEEPYTLAMVFEEFIRTNPDPRIDYSILASDISTKVLQKAINAVYPLDSLNNIPLEIKKRYFLKGKNTEKPVVRLKPEIRNKVSFKRLNFMDEDFSVGPLMDIIFCRNVLIYFDKQTQEQVIRKFLRNLNRGGYLFLGHSETIFGMDLPLKTVSPTVFQKTE